MVILTSQELRIAIGLSVLKCRPPGKCLSYLLCDLRNLFPALPLRHSEEETWRDRALQLEGTLREMKTISESEHIELLALRASGATPSYLSDTGTESSTTMPATGSKKQKKSKKPASSTHIPVAMPHLGTKIDMFLSSDDHLTWHPPPLAQALRTLQSLVDIGSSALDSERPSAVVSVASTLGCIDAIGHVLSVALSQRSSMNDSIPSPMTLLPSLSDIVPRILCYSFPLIAGAYAGKRKAQRPTPTVWDDKMQADSLFTLYLQGDSNIANAFDAVLGSLCTRILTPAVRSIVPACSTRLEAFLHAPKSSVNRINLTSSQPQTISHVDPTDIVYLLHSVRQVLDNICVDISQRYSKHSAALTISIQTLLDGVVLEALRELDGLYNTSELDSTVVDAALHSQSSHTDSGSQTPTIQGRKPLRLPRSARIKHLARREALHHLYHVLSFCLDPAPGLSSHSLRERPPSAALRLALEGKMGVLLRKCLNTKRTSSAGVPEGPLSEEEEESGLEIDETEEGMVLALLEKVWRYGLDLNAGSDMDREYGDGLQMPEDA